MFNSLRDNRMVMAHCSIDLNVGDQNDEDRNEIDENQDRHVVTDHIERSFFPFDATRDSNALDKIGSVRTTVRSAYFEVITRPA
jgi:hypothetical protein